MSSTTVYTTREFNLDSCKFSKPEKFQGYHESFVNINGSNGFILQTPKLVLRNSTSSVYELLISRNKDRNREFYNIMSHIEDSAILQITDKSEEWFGRKITKEQVESMFRSSLNRPLDVDDPFIFKIGKIDKLSNVGSDMINYPVVCLIKINGIIFGKNSSMLDMKVVQIKVLKTEKISSQDNEGDDQNSEHVAHTEKPFYNDNASVMPSHFPKNDEVVNKVVLTSSNVPETVQSSVQEEQEQMEEIKKCEKLIEKVEEANEIAKPNDFSEPAVEPAIEPAVEPAVEPVVEDVPLMRQETPVPVREDTPAPSRNFEEFKYREDFIKYEIMKALTTNDLPRLRELTEQMAKLMG